MWVRMFYHISGGRQDGQEWPPVGGVFEVSDGEGRHLVAGDNAVEVPAPADAEPAEPAPPPEPAEPAGQVPPSAPVITEDEHDRLEAVADGTEEPQADGEPGPPAPTAAKQDWVDYAVSRGASPAEASSLTKSQLQQAYGGRLLLSDARKGASNG